MPFRKVPVLEIDGIKLNQSMAISRYLAKKAGLAGADEWESLLIDIAVDNINDLRLGKYNRLYLFDNNTNIHFTSLKLYYKLYIIIILCS